MGLQRFILKKNISSKNSTKLLNKLDNFIKLQSKDGCFRGILNWCVREMIVKSYLLNPNNGTMSGWNGKFKFEIEK
jgi:hypothetical protein